MAGSFGLACKWDNILRGWVENSTELYGRLESFTKGSNGGSRGVFQQNERQRGKGSESRSVGSSPGPDRRRQEN